jgi:thiol-disulfide isomerase/thioredoxin
MNTGAWVLLIAVVGALAFGLYRAMTDGRFRGTHRVHDAAPPVEIATEQPLTAVTSVLADTPWTDELGERATLLQFSSAFCAPCRATRRILEDVATTTPGIAHLEVDAEHHLDLVRRLGILRTPTTIVLDSHGGEVTRATGAPSKQQVLVALGRAVSDPA